MPGTPVAGAILERGSEDGRATDRACDRACDRARGIEVQEDPASKVMEKAGEREQHALGSDDDDEEDERHGPWQATINGLKAFWRFFKKPLGFFVTIYMLNGKPFSFSTSCKIFSNTSKLLKFLCNPANIQISSDCLGWYAFPPPLQRRTSHVQAHLQRHQLPSSYLDRNRFPDPQRPFLRHRLRSNPLAIPRSLLLTILANVFQPIPLPQASRNQFRMVSSSCRNRCYPGDYDRGRNPR